MNAAPILIRNARPEEFIRIGELMVDAYSQIEGFPKAADLPGYYQMLANVGELTKNSGTELLVALTNNVIRGAVVYIGEMNHYGSMSSASQVKNASGFRLLAVDPASARLGIGKKLSLACIEKARADGKQQVVIHTTRDMHNAWKMYESIGFKPSPDLDFEQAKVYVYGFRLVL